MTTYYFVLLITFHGAVGWHEVPRQFPSLKWCQAEGIKNKTMLGASFGNGLKWKCEKREQKL